jgi:hypothetical protein
MKKLYSLFALIALLFATSGCEDDYRSMVLFEGVEPIYQIGTCDNLVSFLSFYLSETEGETVLGIDGGDGSYRVINEHESVASVTFTDDVNGYQRIKIHPLAEGETIVKVMDGSGESTQLRITVRSRRQYTMTKMGFEYGISGDAPTELLGEVSEELSNRPWLENTGYYVLVPDKECSNFLEKGVLEIYRTGKEDKPLVGRYDTVPVEDEDGDTYALWQFTCNGEQRLFTRTVTGNEGSSVVKCVLAENVTPFCSSGLLPEGVLVIYREKFTVRME